MKKIVPLLITVTFLTMNVCLVNAETNSATPGVERDVTYGRRSLGSSLFLLGNLAPGDPPYYFLLNYGHQLTPNDIIFAEAITWTYYEPLGTYGASDKHYPGKIRAYGVGAGYQRFLLKNVYITVQAIPFHQQFFNTAGNAIQSGIQLYLQSRLGYHFEFLRQRWFLEPSVAFNYWPVNTHFPDAFKEVESGKPNYFLFEPGLHFGYKF
ncbi:MAG: hypothetical protein OEW08_04210 [Gammaproteobacteria bacterium]|nr:hypothetical protein [Gammaproteobacteria bacterium]